MKVRAVIYDFDGVINDSFREGLRRIKVLCAIYDVRFTVEERRRLVGLWGLPGIELLEKGLDISQELAKVMYKAWERVDLQDPVALIPGAKEVLFWCRKNGIKNALLTTRNKKNIHDIFDRLDLIREFFVISTRQDVTYRKPDPRAFRFCLEELEKRGISKEECIFIGDTREDNVAGDKAGIETLIVQTGPYLLRHFASHPIKKLENILRSIDDLPEWIEEYHDEKIEYDYV